MNENVKRAIKKCIPWRLRYYLKYSEARSGRKIPMKYKADEENYYDAFFRMLKYMDAEDLNGKTFCEMGPGQKLTHAALAWQLGGDASYFLDIGDLAGEESYVKDDRYIRLPEGRKPIKNLPEISEKTKWIEYLEKISSKYYTNGLEDYYKIPDGSVDYLISDAVFEHIRKKIFRETISETWRFMAPGGKACHIVDLSDHFGGKKNNLRFPDSKWEDEIHYRMENYTNRLSCKEICDICTECGFTILECKKKYYEKPPVKRSSLAPEFRDRPDDELMISGFVLVLSKNENSL